VTIIIAAYDKGSAAIAGDSGAFEDEALVMEVVEPKVWRAGESLVGVAGSFRVMEHARKVALGDPEALRNSLVEANLGASNWSVLVVNKRGIWEITDDFSIVHVKDHYCAVGGSNQIAIGAMAVLSGERAHPATAIVRRAMAVTLKHSPLAKGPAKHLTI